MKHISLIAIFLTLSMFLSGQSLAGKYTTLDHWQFAKYAPEMWTRITLPHSCNGMDGHSAKYYRGKTYYRHILTLSEDQLAHPTFLHFEMAGQASSVTINGTLAFEHRGGYTPFTVALRGLLHTGENEIIVMCDNTEDVQLAPVSSDFNKNNGLYGRVFFLEMGDLYLSPYTFGQYRLHVGTPSVSESSAEALVSSMLVNSTPSARRLQIRTILNDAEGNSIVLKKTKVNIPAGDSLRVESPLLVKNPRLWNGLADPYLYTARVEILDDRGNVLDAASSKVGFRYFSVDPEKGFSLNGKPYPLRGVSVHQDWDGLATALSKEQFDTDYAIVRELGTNFLRLAHYPHCDYAFQLCDSLGILVQTEIPWLNICGVRAEQRYFDNLHLQMNEMITNFYNHPSIICWGMWNEIDSWGNNDNFQGPLDPARTVAESNKLYQYAKSLDPARLIGLTDDSDFMRPGYTNLKGDYYSQNKYAGWYFGKISDFTPLLRSDHERMGIVNVSEYGCGINPYCHSLDPIATTKIGTGGSRHDEEFGNYYHEQYLYQIMDMPFLFFTSSWVLFDFAVADRLEGYMDTEDGENFTENEFRKYTNDKGFVTRDRKLKKDIFYLYKSLWNHEVQTVYITSRRFTIRPVGQPITIKVYSNASELTLYQNGRAVQTLKTSGEKSGVVWTFAPIPFETASDTFRVCSSDGTSDEVTFKTR